MATHTLLGSAKVMKALNDISKKMGNGSVEVGLMENATYPNGVPVAAVAFWNEFGVPSRKQPPRPFFRQMIANESPQWPKTMASLIKASNYDGKRVLALMGEDIDGALQQSINTLMTPALAQSTKDKKGFDKPLIDTAHLLNSVTYRVKE